MQTTIIKQQLENLVSAYHVALKSGEKFSVLREIREKMKHLEEELRELAGEHNGMN